MGEGWGGDSFLAFGILSRRNELKMRICVVREGSSREESSMVLAELKSGSLKGNGRGECSLVE